jgi:hypothetical protein
MNIDLHDESSCLFSTHCTAVIFPVVSTFLKSKKDIVLELTVPLTWSMSLDTDSNSQEEVGVTKKCKK